MERSKISAEESIRS